jgi:hypothetical protein
MPTATALIDLTNPVVLGRELSQIREETEALIKRLDAVEAAQDDIAAAARAGQIHSRNAGRLAEDVAVAAAAACGHLRMAIATGLKEGERIVKRIADQMTEATAGRH